ncbi:MAG TPA: hypothetical protein EYG63_04760 [Gammaproteobacteria bacterium]|nr:hypothetical protein [Gammaproteobacteria bacterium]
MLQRRVNDARQELKKVCGKNAPVCQNLMDIISGAMGGNMPAATGRAEFDKWINDTIARYPRYAQNREVLNTMADHLYSGDRNKIKAYGSDGNIRVDPNFARGRLAFEHMCETLSGRHTEYEIFRPVGWVDPRGNAPGSGESDQKTADQDWWDPPDEKDAEVRKKECEILMKIVNNALGGDKGTPAAWQAYRIILTRMQARYGLDPAYMTPASHLSRFMPMGMKTGARIDAGVARLKEICDAAGPPSGGAATTTDTTVDPDTGQSADVDASDYTDAYVTDFDPEQPSGAGDQIFRPDQTWENQTTWQNRMQSGVNSPHDEPFFNFPPGVRHINNPIFLQSLVQRTVGGMSRHMYPIGNPVYGNRTPYTMELNENQQRFHRRIINADRWLRGVDPLESFVAIPPSQADQYELGENAGDNLPYPPAVWTGQWPPPRADTQGTPIALATPSAHLLTAQEGAATANMNPLSPMQNPGAFQQGQVIHPVTGVITGAPGAPPYQAYLLTAGTRSSGSDH